MKSNNLTALAIGATAAIGVLALLSVLRADSMTRRGRDDADRRAQAQIDRWDGEGGQIAQETLEEQESGLGHA